MKFELTVLGCGSAVPTSVRNSAAQVLNVLERHFLIDCAEATQLQLRRFHIPYTKINHIFISHLHGDHFLGLFGLLSTLSLQNRKGEIHLYADERLKKILDFQFGIMNIKLSYTLVFHALSRKQELLYEDDLLTVESFPLKHRYDAPASGFLFREKERLRTIRRDMVDAWEVPIAFMQNIKRGEDFVTKDGRLVANRQLTLLAPAPRSYAYMSDTVYREEFAEYVRGVDLLYHEATYGRDFAHLAKETFHSTAEQAAMLAKKADVGRLLLGHFSSRYPTSELLLDEARAIFSNTFVCHDGDVFDVPYKKI